MKRNQACEGPTQHMGLTYAAFYSHFRNCIKFELTNDQSDDFKPL